MDTTASTAISLDTDPDELPPVQSGIGFAIAALWRWRWRFLAVCLVVALLGSLVFLLLPQRFTAHSTVMVGFRHPAFTPTDQPLQAPRREVDVDSEIDFITSFPSLKRVIDQLGLVNKPPFNAPVPPPRPGLVQWLRNGLTSLVSGTSEDGRPLVLAPTPEERTAQMMLRRLKVERVGRSTLVDIAYSDRDPKLAATISNALARGSSQNDGFLKNLSLAEQSGFEVMTTSLVAEALIPWEPSSPNLLMVLAPTVLLAIGIGVSVVALSQYRATRYVLSREDVTSKGLQPLGLVPAPGAAPFADAVAGLHVRLATLRRDKRTALVLMFTSALPGEGAASIVAELGRVMARSGLNILVVDAGAWSPGAAPHQPPPAASDTTEGGSAIAGIVTDTGTANLHRVAADSFSASPPTMQLVGAIAGWRRTYDIILIDSPAVLTSSSARVIGSLADYGVLVVRWYRTSWVVVMHALRLLADSGTVVAGLTLSEVDFSKLSRFSLAEGQTYPTRRATVKRVSL